MSSTKCKHAGCTCTVSEEKDYCSAACHDSKSGETCQCGHPGCAGGQHAETVGAR